MKILKSLPFRLVLAIIIGLLLGLVIPRPAMSVVVTIQYILNQLITFTIPLIIIGFIAPSITKLGSNATRILFVAVMIAYLSSLLASVFSMVGGYVLIPHIHIAPHLEDLRELPEVIFHLDIPQVMSVMSALVFSVFIGVAVVWTKASAIDAILQEFQAIVLKIVEKIIIPILPFFILTTFCNLAWEGTITRQLTVFLVVILIVLVGHFIWIGVLYGAASAYAKRSGWEVIRHYGPAYLTAIGTMSSAATLSVALDCAHKSKNLRSDMVDFGVPLFANIHLCGSVLTEVFFCMTVSLILYGSLPPLSSMILFVIFLGVFAIGAPGVPGGTVMASLGLITGVLGFDAEGTALMLAVFALQDSFGTACNIVGDGALTLILTGFADRKGIQRPA